MTIAKSNRALYRRILQEKNMMSSLCREIGSTILSIALLFSVAGCSTTGETHASSPQKPAAAIVSPPAKAISDKSLVLQEGDTIHISFPGAANLDTTQVVRRDGMVTLEMVGEYQAAGKTPSSMETDLKKLYKTQLVNNDVSVTVQQSAFVVYVMGMVAKPGKLMSDRPLNILEALIEAGVDSAHANMKAVQVVRTDAMGNTTRYKLNLYKILHSSQQQMPDFTLRPYDVINVPERFSWY
jgi:polysaccharide export outer membrane protein